MRVSLVMHPSESFSILNIAWLTQCVRTLHINASANCADGRVSSSAEDSLHSGQIVGVGQIGGQDLSLVSRTGGKSLREILHGFPAPRNEEQVVAVTCQAIGIDSANSCRGAGDN